MPNTSRRSPLSWTIEEAGAFLAGTAQHRLYPAFVLLVFYGLRRGEVLGLRWRDVDFTNHQLHIRQQLQDLRHGRAPTTRIESSH